MTTNSYVADVDQLVATANRLTRERNEARDEAERMRPVVEASLALRDANTDDDISQAWADFDQAVDDYRAAPDV